MIPVTAAVIEQDGALLIARRKPEDRFGGVWEFPGGKVEEGETPEEGLQREILEELGLEVEIGRALGVFPFVSPAFSIELIAFRARIIRGDIVLNDHAEVRWVDRSALSGFSFAEPDRPLVRLLIQERSDDR
jgi:8-oxo-dGTP diphosphatase